MHDPSWAQTLRSELLASGPEAAQVLAHPAVAAAVERGGGAALERALRLARPVAGTRGEAALIDAMLARRRLFLEPVKSAPTMARVNGIGTALHGADDRARDGTYVATLFFTFVFLPVFPLSSWLVRDAGGRSWNFLGKVPLSRAHRIWRWALAGLVGVAVLASVFLRPPPKTVRPTLHVVNDLDVPVTVLVGPLARAVGAHAVVTLDLPAGTHAAVAKGPKDTVLEARDLVLGGDDRFYAWNVLGAGPLRIVTFVYVKTTAKDVPERPPTIDDFAGTSFVVAPPVQYPFREPPEQLRMFGDTTTRRRAFVLEGGLATACEVLVGADDAAGAATLAERVALATGVERSIGEASQRLATTDRARVLPFAERVLAFAPHSIEAHRTWQTAMEWDGRKAEALSVYRKAFEAKPDDGDAAYLYARLLPTAEALAVLTTALGRHPDHRWLLRSSAWNHLQRLAFAPADAAFERLARVDPSMVRDLLAERVRAMVGAGRVEDAQRLALASVGPGGAEALLVYGRLRRLTGPDRTLPSVADAYKKLGSPDATADAEELAVAASTHDAAYFDRVVARAPALDRTFRDAARVTLLAGSDVAAAADLVATLPDAAFTAPLPFAWDVTTRVSVGCELVRTSRADLAQRFYAAGGPVDPTEVAKLSDPTIALRDEDLDLELRAAFLHALARRASDAAERGRLLADARACDVFRSVVPPDAK